ncbi:hypothetical protein [Flavobacterium soyangense]|uniref:hypothetical protein n=1 Tax=Flavobacterium soyangense TaxID=2023265 RepID=UPI001E2F6587|nr:hypothetical protein [Flavobacterium soyangense]
MSTFENKRSLLSEMIAFATVDGSLHKKEYAFLGNCGKKLNIDKTKFIDVFHQDLPRIVIKSEFERFQ